MRRRRSKRRRTQIMTKQRWSHRHHGYLLKQTSEQQMRFWSGSGLVPGLRSCLPEWRHFWFDSQPSSHEHLLMRS